MNQKQIASITISPDLLTAPEKVEPYIRRIAEHGYWFVDLFMRRMDANLYLGTQTIHDCLKKINDLIHKYGMKAMLDTDVTHWGRTFCEKHPECGIVLFKQELCKLHRGKFRCCLKKSKVGLYDGHIVCDRIEVYLKENGSYRHLSPEEYTADWQNYQYGYEIQGQLRRILSGEISVCVGTRIFCIPDLAHPTTLRAQEEVLEMYKDIPFDGFGWDEPGKCTMDLTCFKTGDAYLEFFRKRNGYDLVDKLPLLFTMDNTPEAIKVRVDYSSTFSDVNYEAQRLHNEYAKKLYGDHLFFGTHQTWSGLPADLATGIIDYFRLGKVLSAGWTDGSWESDLRYITFHFMLADSLRTELGFTDAYYNDWGIVLPAVENMHFATRYKMLFHINWFNTFYSESAEFIINYRLEPMKSEAKKDVGVLDSFNQYLGNLMPEAPVGILYDWKSLAAAPKWLSRIHYATIGNTALSLTDAGMFARLFSEDALLAGKLEDGIFHCGNNAFRVLLLPNLYVLSEPAWKKLQSLAAQGFPVIFYGIPPVFTPEGKSMKEVFGTAVGCAPVDLPDVVADYTETDSLPGVNEWEKETFDALYKPVPTDGVAEYDSEGRIICIGKGSMMFLPEADPRENLERILRKWISEEHPVFANRCYSRWFTAPDSRDKVLFLCAHGHITDMGMPSCRLKNDLGLTCRKERKLRCAVHCKSGILTADGGAWCAIRFHDGVYQDHIGDCGNIVWTPSC